MARVSFVASKERSLTKIINGYSIPTGTHWHLADEVYIPINCIADYHWALVVVALKEGVIHVHNSCLGSRRKKASEEVQKLELILSTYIEKSGFFETTEQTN